MKLLVFKQGGRQAALFFFGDPATKVLIPTLPQPEEHVIPNRLGGEEPAAVRAQHRRV